MLVLLLMLIGIMLDCRKLTVGWMYFCALLDSYASVLNFPLRYFPYLKRKCHSELVAHYKTMVGWSKSVFDLRAYLKGHLIVFQIA